jgi:hypothetical protein
MTFVEIFNTLPDIGTIEREDVSDAIDRLAALAPAHVDRRWRRVGSTLYGIFEPGGWKAS